MVMARKENEKEADRPHYYSQFWLDVAAGRRIIGAPKENEGDILEPDLMDAAPIRHSTVAVHDDSDDYSSPDPDGRADNIAHPVVDPIVASDDDIVEPDALEFAEPDEEELDLQDNEVADGDVPDLLDEDEEASEEDEVFDDEEEEDEDASWGRGRKKPSPKRPTKQPAPKKTNRPRRGGF